jgi:hypothetical protein
MDIHTGTLVKNKNMVANAFLKIGVILKNNPGFPERFKLAQKAIIDQMKKSGPPKQGFTPLPTDTALGIVEPKKPTPSLIDAVKASEDL